MNGTALYARPRLHHPGYLLWPRQGALTAQAFDLDRRQLSGELLPVPGGEVVAPSVNSYTSFLVSDNGTILINPGTDRYRLSWLNRDGKVLNSFSQVDRYFGVRASPDGMRVAVGIANPSGDRQIWSLDFARGVSTRVTSGGAGISGLWSPDGRKIVYYPIGATSLFERDASGAGSGEILIQSSHVLYADDFSPDGRYLIYEQLEDNDTTDLWLLPLTGAADRKPVLYLQVDGILSNAQFSPDGQRIAYTSNDSGQQEIYVQGFPKSEGRAHVSNGGGNYARWRGDGKELFYQAPDGRLMAASIGVGKSGLESGPPAALFRISPQVGGAYLSVRCVRRRPAHPHAYAGEFGRLRAADRPHQLAIGTEEIGPASGVVVTNKPVFPWRAPKRSRVSSRVRL